VTEPRSTTCPPGPDRPRSAELTGSLVRAPVAQDGLRRTGAVAARTARWIARPTVQITPVCAGGTWRAGPQVPAMNDARNVCEQLSRPVDQAHLGCFGLGLLGGPFDELAVDEPCPGAHERDEVGCVDGAPAVLCCFDELERHGQPGGP
jgi:hypothetical protein